MRALLLQQQHGRGRVLIPIKHVAAVVEREPGSTVEVLVTGGVGYDVEDTLSDVLKLLDEAAED